MNQKATLFVISRPKSKRLYGKYSMLLTQLRKIQAAREKLLKAEQKILLELSREINQSTAPAEKLG